VLHPDFATLNTEIYFRGDRRNGGDAVLRRLNASVRDRVMAKVSQRGVDGQQGRNAVFDITLEGQNPYRRF
jgi:protocatechuate 3,4-dioxygenase beta subunit